MSAIATVRQTAKKTRLPVMITGDVTLQIPSWVVDHQSYRRWAWSDRFPEHGWISYLGGELWVDLSMEELFTHNRVKARIGFAVMALLEVISLGEFVPDGMLFSNKAVGLSTEPAGLFFFWDTLQSKRLRLVKRPKREGSLELEGSADMVLEVVSDSSVEKDNVILRDLYWRAGVTEYWLVDARGDEPSFQILRHTARGYVATRPKDGWLKSEVFGRSFKLTRGKDPLGHPSFTLEIQP